MWKSYMDAVRYRIPPSTPSDPGKPRPTQFALLDIFSLIVSGRGSRTGIPTDPNDIYLVPGVGRGLLKLSQEGYFIFLMCHMEKVNPSIFEKIIGLIEEWGIFPTILHVFKRDSIFWHPNVGLISMANKLLRLEKSRILISGKEIDAEMAGKDGAQFILPTNLFPSPEISTFTGHQCELAMIMGSPQSGKSTVAKVFHGRGYLILSGDKPINRLVDCVKEATSGSRNVVIDGCPLDRKGREELIRAAVFNGYYVRIIWKIGVNLNIPGPKLTNYSKKIEYPSLNEEIDSLEIIM